jgi:uncharacterized NAD(P)/FAD-binding protein YdhS
MTLCTIPAGRRRIAVIGGGLSGALVSLALLREDAAVEITVYEPSAEIGPGLAYGAAAPWHLLNVIATRASLYRDDPDHWWRWAREHGPRLGWPDTAAATGADYLPRRLFGQYVVAELDRARQRRKNLRLLHHRVAVADIVMNEGRFEVVDADRGLADFDAVVLATGAPVASKFALPGQGDARMHGRWFDNPWDLAALGRIAPSEPVLILGSALTMADTVLTLDMQAHRGSIHVLSRHGIVPVARHEQPALPSGISGDDSTMPLSHLLQRFRHAVRIHGNARWQGVFEGLRSDTNDLWLALPADAQRRFMRHLKGLWDAHRFRMPPATAACLEQLRQRGQLQFHKGSLQGVRLQGESITAQYRPRGMDASEILSVGAIIDCTGPHQPEVDWARRLLDRLQASGLLAGASCGVGYAAAPEGAVRDQAGKVVSGLYLLGPLLRGTLLESTAINELRGQADALAARLSADQVDLRLQDLA